MTAVRTRVSLQPALMRFPLVVVLLAALSSASCRRPGPPPVETRSLRILMGADIATLDPQVPWDNVSAIVLDNIFESLVRFDRSLRLTSGLAERWINPDDRTWRFFLDPEARFPDGKPLKASDVRFSIERLRSLAGSQMTGFARHIVAADVVDDRTIDIHTDIPIAILNSLAFIPIMSEAQVKAAGDKIGERPFGTGAYKLGRWERGKLIVLEANQHHKPVPRIPRVEFHVREDANVLLEDVLRMRPDITLFLPARMTDELQKRKTPELKVVAGGGLAVFYVVFNTRPQVPGSKAGNPLRDVKVRRALAQATDQAELVREGFLGFGRPATQLVVPQIVGFNPLIEPVPFEARTARQVLAPAGQAGLDLTFDVVKGGPHRVEKILIRQWEKAGVHAALRELSADDRQHALEAGSFALTIQGYSCTSADAAELLDYALHSQDAGRGYGVGNFTGFSHPEVDRIAEENLRVFDPKKRLEMLQKAIRIAADELPYLPLYTSQDVYVVSEAVEWAPPINEEVRLQDIVFRPPTATP